MSGISFSDIKGRALRKSFNKFILFTLAPANISNNNNSKSKPESGSEYRSRSIIKLIISIKIYKYKFLAIRAVRVSWVIRALGRRIKVKRLL
jgi:hypothetical protein